MLSSMWQFHVIFQKETLVYLNLHFAELEFVFHFFLYKIFFFQLFVNLKCVPSIDFNVCLPDKFTNYAIRLSHKCQCCVRIDWKIGGCLVEMKIRSAKKTTRWHVKSWRAFTKLTVLARSCLNSSQHIYTFIQLFIIS